MRSVLLSTGIGLGVLVLFSCAVHPEPAQAPQPSPPVVTLDPTPIREVSAPPSTWELVVPAGSPGGPSRRVLSAAEVESYVQRGLLKLDGDAVQSFSTGRMTRAGPRRFLLVRSSAPLAAELR